MSDIEVGDAPMKYVNIKSMRACPKCGTFMIDKMPAPRKRQLGAERAAGRTHHSVTFCPRCNYRC